MKNNIIYFLLFTKVWQSGQGQETVREQLRCAVLKGREREQALSDLNEELL